MIWEHSRSSCIISESVTVIDHSHRTLHKVHTFVEAQQEKMGIKMFFRQGEMTTLLKNCTTGLEQALEVFMASWFSIFTYGADQQYFHR
jgi:hypothetical protein